MQRNESQDNSERLQQWALIAAGRELLLLSAMPDHKVSKPGSPYSIALVKLASICKGAGRGYLVPDVVFERIRHNSSHLHVGEKEAARMWRRAMKIAYPRYPKADEIGHSTNSRPLYR